MVATPATSGCRCGPVNGNARSSTGASSRCPRVRHRHLGSRHRRRFSSATGSSTSSTITTRCESGFGKRMKATGRAFRWRSAPTGSRSSRPTASTAPEPSGQGEPGRETRRDASGRVRRSRLARQLLHERAELDQVHGVPQVRHRRRHRDPNRPTRARADRRPHRHRAPARTGRSWRA